jgi:hypothetical protein
MGPVSTRIHPWPRELTPGKPECYKVSARAVEGFAMAPKENVASSAHAALENAHASPLGPVARDCDGSVKKKPETR